MDPNLFIKNRIQQDSRHNCEIDVYIDLVTIRSTSPTNTTRSQTIAKIECDKSLSASLYMVYCFRKHGFELLLTFLS